MQLMSIRFDVDVLLMELDGHGLEFRSVWDFLVSLAPIWQEQ